MKTQIRVENYKLILNLYLDFLVKKCFGITYHIGKNFYFELTNIIYRL